MADGNRTLTRRDEAVWQQSIDWEWQQPVSNRAQGSCEQHTHMLHLSFTGGCGVQSSSTTASLTMLVALVSLTNPCTSSITASSAPAEFPSICERHPSTAGKKFAGQRQTQYSGYTHRTGQGDTICRHPAQRPSSPPQMLRAQAKQRTTDTRSTKQQPPGLCSSGASGCVLARCCPAADQQSRKQGTMWDIQGTQRPADWPKVELRTAWSSFTSRSAPSKGIARRCSTLARILLRRLL